MIRTIEATIDQKGHISLSAPVKLSSSCRALVLIPQVVAIYAKRSQTEKA